MMILQIMISWPEWAFGLKILLCLELDQSIPLQTHVVVVVQIVDADDSIAAREQLLRREESYEAGAAGDEYVQRGLPT